MALIFGAPLTVPAGNPDKNVSKSFNVISPKPNGETTIFEFLSSVKYFRRVILLVLSEFGRTPRINSNAGRDHHARCFSCLVAGGGVKGGQVIGASDKDAMEPVERPVKPSDIHATVCHALGIDHEKEVYTPQDRPCLLYTSPSPRD